MKMGKQDRGGVRFASKLVQWLFHLATQLFPEPCRVRVTKNPSNFREVGRRRWTALKYVLFGSFLLSIRSSAADLTQIRTVFIILMENHNWSSIQANTNCPYINNVLLPNASYSGLVRTLPGIHPSEPNYIWLEAGTNFGILHDSTPAVDHQATPNHLVTLLNQAGISWRTYQEDITGTNIPLVNRGSYAV